MADVKLKAMLAGDAVSRAAEKQSNLSGGGKLPPIVEVEGGQPSFAETNKLEKARRRLERNLAQATVAGVPESERARLRAVSTDSVEDLAGKATAAEESTAARQAGAGRIAKGRGFQKDFTTTTRRSISLGKGRPVYTAKPLSEGLFKKLLRGIGVEIPKGEFNAGAFRAFAKEAGPVTAAQTSGALRAAVKRGELSVADLAAKFTLTGGKGILPAAGRLAGRHPFLKFLLPLLGIGYAAGAPGRKAEKEELEETIRVLSDPRMRAQLIQKQLAQEELQEVAQVRKIQKLQAVSQQNPQLLRVLLNASAGSARPQLPEGVIRIGRKPDLDALIGSSALG